MNHTEIVEQARRIVRGPFIPMTHAEQTIVRSALNYLADAGMGIPRIEPVGIAPETPYRVRTVEIEPEPECGIGPTDLALQEHQKAMREKADRDLDRQLGIPPTDRQIEQLCKKVVRQAIGVVVDHTDKAFGVTDEASAVLQKRIAHLEAWQKDVKGNIDRLNKSVADFMARPGSVGALPEIVGILHEGVSDLRGDLASAVGRIGAIETDAKGLDESVLQLKDQSDRSVENHISAYDRLTDRIADLEDTRRRILKLERRWKVWDEGG